MTALPYLKTTSINDFNTVIYLLISYQQTDLAVTSIERTLSVRFS